MSQVKREFERWEDLRLDVRDVAADTGALTYDPETEEYSCAEMLSAERHAYARIAILHKQRRLDATLAEARDALKAVLDEAR